MIVTSKKSPKNSVNTGVLTVFLGLSTTLPVYGRVNESMVEETTAEFNQTSPTDGVRDKAMRQARLMGNESPEAIHALSLLIEYQGAQWHETHKKTWRMMKDGDFNSAAREVAQSFWNERAPGEVANVQAALKNIAWDLNPAKEMETYELFITHLMKREGYRNEVYEDSEGHLTVGVGHLVRPHDELKLGDTISHEQVYAFLHEDAKSAFDAAHEQMNELGINNTNFLIALGSVNFQLGTGWRDKFSNTWNMIKNGQYQDAIDNLEKSKWNDQTPVRVDDFQYALRLLEHDIEQKASYVAQLTP